MPLVDTITKVKGRAADLKRRLLLNPKQLEGQGPPLCYLLKRAGETKRFAVILQLTGGWIVRYSNWRQQMALEIYTVDPLFANVLAQMDYVAYGVPYGDPVQNKLDVYAVAPAQRDVVPPTVSDAAWKVYLTREPRERFTLP
jgi:hypothetical protein